MTTSTTPSSVTVTTPTELTDAVEAGALEIVVQGAITATRSFALAPGATLRGGELVFLTKGVQLTRDNTLCDITITSPPHEVAVYNDTTVADAGTLRFVDVTTVGQVYLLAEATTRTVRVETAGLHVADADVRGRVEQPYRQPGRYGVHALQGALTLWNRHPDPSATFTATLRGVSAGTDDTPVRGAGIFVAGVGDRDGNRVGGAFTADLIETGTIVTDGGIARGANDKISAGVMIASGATVDRVVNTGAITTHGQTDVDVDNWGTVREWISEAPLTSTGPSGIGFVNFGDITTLDVRAPIVTTGEGARGFNLYDGTLRDARFHSIRTTGDGAVGIQVSKPMGSLTVHHDVETTGAGGLSLYLSAQTELRASAVSVIPGGAIESLTVGGSLRTHGDGVVTLEVDHDARIGTLTVAGDIEALGTGSTATRIDGDVAVRTDTTAA